MGKYVTGSLTCRIDFSSIYVEDGQSIIDAIFPQGFDGEMVSSDIDVSSEED